MNRQEFLSEPINMANERINYFDADAKVNRKLSESRKSLGQDKKAERCLGIAEQQESLRDTLKTFQGALLKLTEDPKYSKQDPMYSLNVLIRKAAFIELDNRVTGDYRKNWGQNLDAEYFFARADEALAFLRFLKKARSKA